jgi:hypothetical protein
LKWAEVGGAERMSNLTPHSPYPSVDRICIPSCGIPSALVGTPHNSRRPACHRARAHVSVGFAKRGRPEGSGGKKRGQGSKINPTHLHPAHRDFAFLPQSEHRRPAILLSPIVAPAYSVRIQLCSATSHRRQHTSGPTTIVTARASQPCDRI